MILNCDTRQQAAYAVMARRGARIHPLGEGGKYELRRRTAGQGGGVVCSRFFPGGERNYARVLNNVILWVNDIAAASKIGD